jgi:hypothetical protein
MEKAQICYPNQNPASKYPATQGREPQKSPTLSHASMSLSTKMFKQNYRDTTVNCTPNFGKSFNISSGLARGQTAIETILIPVRSHNIP